ncbi:GxxExxY protein [Porphyrobacter sp. SLTP]|uniref:GxxExxY protein n=1 Tax=Porphyrobacter sp. SLTP TaxID=2683266 RepID=UPI0014136857|nr:GxxExxY protein [Porphyrobacter sp. SLTP]NBB26578.1 GxxExxY protein [Porphyrobacter sp. SLTP]
MSRDDDLEALVTVVIDMGFRLHQDLGPGLLESAYEMILFEKLRQRGIEVARQLPINIDYDSILIENAFKIDLLIANRLVVELKSVERLHPAYSKQVLTYLRLTKLPLGLLMNFGQPLFKDGLKRITNGYDAGPRP